MRRTSALLALAAAVVWLTPPVAGVQPPAEALQDPAYLFALGQLYRFQGLYEEALDAFSRASEGAPDDPFLHLEFGEFLFQTGRLSEAAEHAEIARAAAPSSREALRLLGRVRLRQAEASPEALEQAQAAFEQLRAMDPLDVEVRVTLGRLYMSRGEFAAAAEALREARDLRRDDRLVTSLLVDALAGVGESAPDAIAELERIVEEDPDFLQARLAVAQVRSRAGDHQGVVEVLEGAPDGVRGNVDFLRLLSFAYYRTGRFEESLATSGRWLERRPQDPMAAYLNGLALSALGRFAEAQGLLEKLVEEEPARPEWTLALAEILERQGRRAEASAVLRSVIDRLDERGEKDESRRIATILAEQLARSGDWEAVHQLTEEVGPDPEAADGDPLVLLRVDALQQTGRFDAALAALEEVVGNRRLGDRALGKRIEILFRAGRTEEAERSLTELTGSDRIERLLLAAEVLHSVDLYSRALPPLRRAVEIESANVEVLFWLGATCERVGDVTEADTTFRRLLDLDENFAPALNYLGYMWADRGENLDEALALVQRAVALEPNNGAYLDSLGWAFFRSGRFEEALEPLEKAARLVVEDPVVFEHLGDLYRQLGRTDEAGKAYRRALSIGGADDETGILRKLEELMSQ